ncbi:ubiquitin-conjugating enzyme E2, partial [Aspergillus saccharolyticus JOP 1030-1]
PPGYIFVQFVDKSQGSSLIHEDELQIIDRTWHIGQIVKRRAEDAMCGRVLSTQTKCTVEPVVYRTTNPLTGEHGPLNFTDIPNYLSSRNKPAQDSHPTLLHDVLASDLQPDEPFAWGDYFIYQQKCGVIVQVDRDPVFLTKQNEVVTLYDPLNIKFPVHVHPDRLVSQHADEETSDLSNYAGAEPGESLRLRPYAGCSAWVGAANMCEVYGARIKDPTGGRQHVHTLAIRASHYHVRWIIPNVFGIGVDKDTATGVPVKIRSSLFRKFAVKCDFSQRPTNKPCEDELQLDSERSIRLGRIVCFRDTVNTAAKYPTYQPIPAEESYGYNLNVFRVVSTESNTTVQWQDGTTTREHSISLHVHRPYPRAEFFPGDIAVLEKSVQKLPLSTRADLGCPICVSFRSQEVGVVQAVDSRERVAFIRWYENPAAEFLLGACWLNHEHTRLGSLSDKTTPASLYELAHCPALRRPPGRLVGLVPNMVHASVLRDSSAASDDADHSSHRVSTHFEATKWYLDKSKRDIVRTEWFKDMIAVDDSPAPTRLSIHYEDYRARLLANFVGMIMKGNPDGTVAVRMTHSNSCVDIELPMERIMISNPGKCDLRYMSTPVSSSDDESESPETNDEADHLDPAEDDADGRGASHVEELDLPHTSHKALEDSQEPLCHHVTMADAEGERKMTGTGSRSSRPLAFLVLDGSPPADHRFFSSENTETSGPNIKRIHKEWKILGTSLPDGIYVRSWESRMDLIRALVIGPAGTPYEYAPFVIDFQLTNDFPNKPPVAFFHYWNLTEEEINPNLHLNGHVCLSLLGTWPAQNPDESWSPRKSSILQILVSIMGLVLVQRPFYNEPGFERLAMDDDERVESIQYTERVFILTRKFILRALERGVSGFDDVLVWLYLPALAAADEMNRPDLLRKVIADARSMIKHQACTAEPDAHREKASAYLSRLSLGAALMLDKYVSDLLIVQTTTCDLW